MFELYLTLTKLMALYNSLEQTNAEIPEIAYDFTIKLVTGFKNFFLFRWMPTV